MGVRLNSNDHGLVELLRVVGLDPKGAVAVMADDLVDVSSWEL
jgi:hypothetical protein